MLKKLWSGLKWLIGQPIAVAWFAGVILATVWIWRVYADIISATLIVLPSIKIAAWTVTPKFPPVPFYPAILFFLWPALIARPPVRRHPEESWVLRFSFVPLREWKSNLRRGRLPFFTWGPKKVRMNWFRRSVRRLSLAAALLTLGITICLPFAKRAVIADDEQKLAAAVSYDPSVSTRVYDVTGLEEICRFTLEDRDYASIDEVPQRVSLAFVAAEDKNFYRHDGVDLIAILRAARENHESGRLKQGGSTISQQVVKQVVLKSNERSLMRKLRELFLVRELERRASKDKILEVYLNHIYLGRAYGIKAAARAYYGKEVKDLSLGEAAFLAGMPKAPSSFSPSMNYARAKERQAYVLGRMREQKFIDDKEMRAALAEDVMVIHGEEPLNRTAAPYFCEHVRRQLEKNYGEDMVYKKGLVVRTTIDMKMQRAAEAAVQNGLIDLERRLGFNGPEGHDDAFAGACKARGESVADDGLETAEVVSNAAKSVMVCVRGNAFPMHADDVVRIHAWENGAGHQLAPGDVLRVRIVTVEEKVSKKETRKVRYALSARRTGGADRPDVLQAAMVVVDPKTGALRALVGGYDFNENQFDMATQGRRQPGSSIKPYIYLTALMRGKTVTDVVDDHPVCYSTASGQWCPRNYSDDVLRPYLGRVDLRTALAKSLNSVSVQLLHEAGVDEGIKTMRRLGLTSPIQRVLPIAIGSLEVSPWEHTYAYATIAAAGRRMPHQCYQRPGAGHVCDESAGVFITKVEDAEGNTLYDEAPTPQEQAVPAADAYAMTYLMEGVVQFGTGHRVKELRRPAAGKTGTTNEWRDAWFMGFTPDLAAGVWVGRQRPLTIARKATGGTVALPIWLAFMKAAHPDTPAREFPVPPDVVLVKGPSGDLIPFQRGRVPEKFLTAIAR